MSTCHCDGPPHTYTPGWCGVEVYGGRKVYGREAEAIIARRPGRLIHQLSTEHRWRADRHQHQPATRPRLPARKRKTPTIGHPRERDQLMSDMTDTELLKAYRSAVWAGFKVSGMAIEDVTGSTMPELQVPGLRAVFNAGMAAATVTPDAVIRRTVDAMDEHTFISDSNLGYYRTEVTCMCGETMWFGQHEGDPTHQQVWSDHIVKAVTESLLSAPESGEPNE